MTLDVRTIMVLFAMLSLLFSGLILLAGLHTRSTNSVKQWSIASLCIAMGLGSAYFFQTPTANTKYAVLLGATLITASIALQFTGIQSFKSSRIYLWPAIIFVSIGTLQTYWFEFIQPDIISRTVANSVLCSIGYAACASETIIRNKPKLNCISRLTGLSFAMLSLAMLIRAILIFQSPPEAYSLYLNIPVNPATFIITCILQLCVTFGFLLMLNGQLVTEIEKLASRDALTGAFNRRLFEDEMARLQSRCKRTGEKFSLMLIDVDNFKLINDNYGHLNGDEILRRLANIVLTSIRTEDYFARYGGDEFCVLLPSTNTAEAHIVANRLRETYAATAFIVAGKTIKSSISVGIVDSSQVGLEFKTLLSAADQALYQAKQSGRNKVVLHSTALDS
ncbi:MAG: GGDEF domain-containing protein [Pseudomonadota bacterium]